MDSSMPGLPVPHRFPEFAQVHIHGISDAILPSHHNSNALYDHSYLLAESMDVSGATLVDARKMGHNWLGAEIVIIQAGPLRTAAPSAIGSPLEFSHHT